MMFSHDGIKDSLTQLAAPPFFYEEIRRELSRFERSHDPFSVIRFVLLSMANSHGKQDDVISRYEVEVLNFAETLTRLSRSEDLCARIGEREFVILLRGSESVAMKFIERVTSTWIAVIEANLGDVTYPDFLSAHLMSRLGEGVLDLLNRLDRQALTPDFVRFRTDYRAGRH